MYVCTYVHICMYMYIRGICTALRLPLLLGHGRLMEELHVPFHFQLPQEFPTSCHAELLWGLRFTSGNHLS